MSGQWIKEKYTDDGLPAMNERVLVYGHKKWGETFWEPARRVRAEYGGGWHWIDDRGIPVYFVSHWQRIVAPGETP